MCLENKLQNALFAVEVLPDCTVETLRFANWAVQAAIFKAKSITVSFFLCTEHTLTVPRAWPVDLLDYSTSVQIEGVRARESVTDWCFGRRNLSAVRMPSFLVSAAPMATTLSQIAHSQIEPSVSHKPVISSRFLSSQISLPPRWNSFFVSTSSLHSRGRLNCPETKYSSNMSAVTSCDSSRAKISIKECENAIIVIDNYDSFTYNLCQYIGELGCKFEVYRNDEVSVEELKRKNPRGVLISPGPGTPQDSGISLETVLELGPIVPLLGVCMGLQCIGEAFGGKIVRSPCGVMHGKGSFVHYDEKGYDGLLFGLSNPFTAGRYHSLVIERDTFPDDILEITAWTEDGLIMAARHREYKHLQGVQFHPESIITAEGKTIIRNFIRMIERREADTLTR
ncbi:hypothetical protein Nepgr_003793 [Nepenthes gracilis]|uniref:anthranilate synthase n=1 Tax=Nepenthes gracilis TaxID=150966 RepID=A0AAD3S0B5_NEPGR|nr:hypothetical protein Nepgr_003793 [Nepenthes gracilis]